MCLWQNVLKHLFSFLKDAFCVMSKVSWTPGAFFAVAFLFVTAVLSTKASNCNLRSKSPVKSTSNSHEPALCYNVARGGSIGRAALLETLRYRFSRSDSFIGKLHFQALVAI